MYYIFGFRVIFIARSGNIAIRSGGGYDEGAPRGPHLLTPLCRK